MSTFESDLEENVNLDNMLFGLCGYGSGAKAKVFEGRFLLDGVKLFQDGIYSRD